MNLIAVVTMGDIIALGLATICFAGAGVMTLILWWKSRKARNK